MMRASQALRHMLTTQRDRRAPYALLVPAAAPQLMCSSPHAMTLRDFTNRHATSPHRITLLHALDSQLAALRAVGLVPLCLLVGGSFLRDGDIPGDLDALLVYRFVKMDGVETAPTIPSAGTGLDLRYVPADAEPELLIKMSCFFHTLYQSRDRTDGAQPSLIVSIRDDL